MGSPTKSSIAIASAIVFSLASFIASAQTSNSVQSLASRTQSILITPEYQEAIEFIGIGEDIIPLIRGGEVPSKASNEERAIGALLLEGLGRYASSRDPAEWEIVNAILDKKDWVHFQWTGKSSQPKGELSAEDWIHIQWTGGENRGGKSNQPKAEDWIHFQWTGGNRGGKSNQPKGDLNKGDWVHFQWSIQCAPSTTIYDDALGIAGVYSCNLTGGCEVWVMACTAVSECREALVPVNGKL